ncbi:MAG: FliH/SctL family protein, partial [Desulfovibrionaceae bacterium]
MRTEVDNKKWGTIYLGSDKEATLDSLDAMQAAARQEQWNQRTQNEYMDRVRQRAADRAREILGAAHTERQNLLTEARAETERMRLESQVQYAKAEEARTQAEALKAEAEAIRAAAQQQGFDTGLANARDELDAFRSAMGSSIAVVLQAIERQNGALFTAWREDVVDLVKICVEKGTNWVLDTHYAEVLRALVFESVRQLDARRTVTLRVHPDDEAAVTDMFAAAREAMPDVEHWIVNGDPEVQLGGLIAESPSSTVDNRVELRRTLVNNVLQHLTLPEGEADVIAESLIHEVVAEQVAKIAQIAPPIPETAPDADIPAESAAPTETLSPAPDAPDAAGPGAVRGTGVGAAELDT